MAKPNRSKRETSTDSLRRHFLATIVAIVVLASSPAHATISFVKNIGTASSTSSGTSLTVTVPAAGVAGGNSVIVSLAFDPASGTVSCTDTGANSYAVDKDVTNGSGTSGVRAVILSAHNVTALVTGNTITCTHPSAAARAMSANEFSGLVITGTRDQTASGTGSSTSPSSGSTSTTTQASELLIGTIGVEGKSTETFTPGSGYATIGRVGTSQGNAASNITVDPEYKLVSATGAYSATATLGTSTKWAAAIVTYKAALPPTKLAIVSVNGGSSPTADAAFPVVIQAQDVNGIPSKVSGATGINLLLKTGTGPLGGTLTGTISAGTNQVTISGVTYTKAESGVSLTAARTSGDSLTSGDSATFTVNSGPAAVLSFSIQPGDTIAGTTILGPPTVLVKDAFGNNVTSSTSVTMTFGDFSGGATLSGTTTKSTTGGTASFTDLRINKANIYTLKASVTGAPSVTSNLFNITRGTATKLGFAIQPGNSTTSGAITGPPTVAVQDDQGNTVISSSASISIAIGTNPGGGTLTGTTAKNASSGIAAFADLKIDHNGTGYTLTATSTGLTSATTSTFNITSGGSVAGTVSKSGSGAISGATVLALQSGVVKGAASTDSAGSYTISGLAPGTYDIHADAGGFSPQTQSGVTVTAGTTATANFTLTNTNPTQGIVYIYDELQRLKSVIDPVGEATTYAYDAVGNLLSITRNNSSQTSIVDFNPNGGLVGNTVTIYGTGYSATPSQNSVTFNGVAATVTSSTLTQIVTTVPSGATTGSIAVTSPAGTATSSTAFNVTSTSGAPTISNFTPLIGSPGAALTINGTNFDTTPSNTELKINNIIIPINSLTSTAINTTIPTNRSSGRIFVRTLNGEATSANYLFIVPSPYTPADVEYTGSIQPGGSSQTGLRPIDWRENLRI